MSAQTSLTRRSRSSSERGKAGPAAFRTGQTIVIVESGYIWTMYEQARRTVSKDRRDKAIEYFSAGMHCSQAVLAAFSEECGISEEQAFRLGSCFGSGMRKGQVCGACTGALMVLGLLYGQRRIGDQEGRELSNRIDDLMMERFEKANGSFICNDLLGCDISTPEGAKRAYEEGLFTDLCPKMVGSAVDILEGIIGETEGHLTDRFRHGVRPQPPPGHLRHGRAGVGGNRPEDQGGHRR